MSQTRRLIATIGAIAAAGFLVLALIYWVFVANPPLSFSGIDWPLRILIIAAIVSFSVYLIAAPESIGRAASRRSNRLTANAFIAGLVALAIAIFANVVFGTLPVVRADLTAGQTFTLSDQTKKVLQDLKKPVTAVAFYSSSQGQGGVSRPQMEDELKSYQSYSTNFKYEFVDPYVNPARATQYGVTRLGSVVFDNGVKREIANGISEAEFTGALVRLQQTGTQTVAFLTGHGERDPNGTDQGSYSNVRDTLEKDNYKTLTWSLVTSPTLSVDQVTVLVIAEPLRPITAKELQTIGTYLDNGGHMLLLLDPQMPAAALTPAASLLQKYGVSAMQGGVVDILKHFGQDPTVVGADTYQDSDITRDLNRDHLATLFPLSLMLKPPTSTVGGLTANAFIQSSAGGQSSWLETDLNGLSTGALQYDEGKDVLGPATLGLSLSADTATNPTSTVKTRIVAYGDADFPSNVILSQGLSIANLDLFANSVSWLAGANELVSIRAKDPAAPRTVTLDSRQQTVLFASTVLALPLLIALAGTFVWWRRR